MATMTEKAKKANNDKVIISPSLLIWDPSKYVYNPAFDLGIGEEWLPTHPLASEDDIYDTEFWQSIAMNEEDCERSCVSTSVTTTLNTPISSNSSYVH